VSSILNCEFYQICGTLSLLIEPGKICCFSRDSSQRGSILIITVCSMMHGLAEKCGFLTSLNLILKVESKSIFFTGIDSKRAIPFLIYAFPSPSTIC
jgi:hypothetical protein